jgi:RNA polymerase sigma factor (sigma-70 family)
MSVVQRQVTPLEPLESISARATAGDAGALALLCEQLASPVFRICLRMLGDPAEAEDAAQEVLIKVVTNLGSFEGRSKLMTWVHRIAARHVLAMRKSRAEERALDPDAFAALLERGLAFQSTPPAPTAEDEALVNEIRLSCTQGMLLVLGREERLALVLVDLLGFDGAEAADVASASHDAFRQRLARARAKLGGFLQARCGLASAEAPCRCQGQLAAKKALGLTQLRLSPLSRGDAARTPLDVTTAMSELRAVRALGAAFDAGGDFTAPATLRARMHDALPTLLRA